MTVAIIEYNAGNLLSVIHALDRLDTEYVVSADAAVLQRASKVIFPGVGEASTTMRYLKERGLDALIKDLKQPVLGICLGMQLMCSHSAENDTPCLGIFSEQIEKFTPNPQNGVKVPHMGWNGLQNLRGPLFSGLAPDEEVYFVHSYYAAQGDDTVASTVHGEVFSAALSRDNFFAVQFHPEKSGPVGERILKNFLTL